MRRLILVGLLLCGSVKAQDFGQEARVLAYWEKSFGGFSTMRNAASFGFKLSTSASGSSASPSKAATVDVRFDGRGIRSLGLNGIVLRQDQSSGGAPSAEVNWWIVGGMVIGAGVVAHQENRKSKRDENQSQPCRPAVIFDPDTRQFITICR